METQITNLQEELKIGENYHIIERFCHKYGYYPKNRIKINQTECNAKYLARLESVLGNYYCFGRITQLTHIHKFFLPSLNEIRETKMNDLVVIIALKEGSFKVNERNIITNPRILPEIIGFENNGSTDSEAKLCRELMYVIGGKLREAGILRKRK